MLYILVPVDSPCTESSSSVVVVLRSTDAPEIADVTAVAVGSISGGIVQMNSNLKHRFLLNKNQ